MQITYDSIIKDSLVDGPGQRAVLFMQGCPIQCPDCQNKRLWLEDGMPCSVMTTATQLLATGLPITISGGEPFAQPEALAELMWRLKMLASWNVHVIIYSGYVYEDLLLMSTAIPEIATVLALADVLVDGPYVAKLDHDQMQYRGSSNQRVIDLQATCSGDVITLDWDTPEVVVTIDGNLVGAEGIVTDFANLGQVNSNRRCGQS